MKNAPWEAHSGDTGVKKGQRHYPELAGEQVIVRAPKHEDVVALYHALSDPEVTWWLARDAPSSIEETRSRYMEAEDTPSGLAYRFVIAERSADAAIGVIGLRQRGPHGNVGFWLGRQYWGKGYMTEALRLVIEFAFARCNFRKVEASAVIGNERSRRVLERVGFILEGQRRREYYKPSLGRWRDAWLFGITREDWEGISQGNKAEPEGSPR